MEFTLKLNSYCFIHEYTIYYIIFIIYQYKWALFYSYPRFSQFSLFEIDHFHTNTSMTCMYIITYFVNFCLLKNKNV